ncbi:hypothetical protein BC567DRAFT_292118 [Phyllosticta citribraziliensis]
MAAGVKSLLDSFEGLSNPLEGPFNPLKDLYSPLQGAPAPVAQGDSPPSSSESSDSEPSGSEYSGSESSEKSGNDSGGNQEDQDGDNTPVANKAKRRTQTAFTEAGEISRDYVAESEKSPPAPQSAVETTTLDLVDLPGLSLTPEADLLYPQPVRFEKVHATLFENPDKAEPPRSCEPMILEDCLLVRAKKGKDF